MKNYSLTIDGMSCQHCVMRVQKAVSAFEGVKNLEVKIGSAVFEAPESLDISQVISAIESEGYKAALV